MNKCARSRQKTTTNRCAAYSIYGDERKTSVLIGWRSHRWRPDAIKMSHSILFNSEMQQSAAAIVRFMNYDCNHLRPVHHCPRPPCRLRDGLHANTNSYSSNALLMIIRRMRLRQLDWFQLDSEWCVLCVVFVFNVIPWLVPSLTESIALIIICFSVYLMSLEILLAPRHSF